MRNNYPILATTFRTSMKITQKLIWFCILPILLILNSPLCPMAMAENTDTKKITAQQIHSEALDRTLEIGIHLPSTYSKSKRHFPVVYVLNANDFYLGNILEDTQSTIDRSLKFKDIPESILVSINSSSWYGDVINNADSFYQFIARELPKFINAQYRTLPVDTIVGHSYAAAFLSTKLASSSHNFDLIAAISPVYPSVDFITAVGETENLVCSDTSALHIVQGDERTVNLEILKMQLAECGDTTRHKSNTPFKHKKFMLENHQSVFPVGVNYIIRTLFADYSTPPREKLKKTAYQYEDIVEYYQQREIKYNVKTTEDDLQGAIGSLAHDYLALKKFELAFPLWEKYQTRFKVYFLNFAAERFIALEDHESAIKIWQKMTEFFPQHPLPYYQLAESYAQMRQLDHVKKYQNKVESLLASINADSSERELNQFAHHLLNKKSYKKAIDIFLKITKAFPNSAAAFNNLGRGYETSRQTEPAKAAYKKAVQLASKNKDSQLERYQSNLNKLKAQQYKS